MNIVPLQAVPSQKIKTVLANTVVQIVIRQLRYGMFLDLYVNDVAVPEVGGVICENLNRIIRNGYLNMISGFSGDLVFWDTQGSSDPTFDGLGTRYQLIYLSPADLTALGVSE